MFLRERSIIVPFFTCVYPEATYKSHHALYSAYWSSRDPFVLLVLGCSNFKLHKLCFASGEVLSPYVWNIPPNQPRMQLALGWMLLQPSLRGYTYSPGQHP